jgi:nicotinamide phosphoribosyltransferase
MFAVVSDSYDIYNAVQNIWGGTLRQRVLESGATLVVRPDSGEPVKVVPRVIGLLMDTFGSELNKKGYHVLNKAVRVIQGDGVNSQSIEDILNALKAERISAENIAFGMGGALLQQVNRDMLGFAMKASAIRINGEWHDVFKKPITDPGKNSRGGRLSVVYDSALGRYKTVRRENCGASPDLLRPVFKDGELLVEDSFSNVRKRAAETSL